MLLCLIKLFLKKDLHSKMTLLHSTVFIRRQMCLMVQFSSNNSVVFKMSNKEIFGVFRDWMSHRPPGFIVSCPLKPSMSSFKRFASLNPLIADSDISAHSRSELWLVPCPNAQHSASINMAISSLHLTHLSRIGTASPHRPCSISRLACALVTSICS